MNKTEFRIDEVTFYNNVKHYYIFYKTFNIFGFPKWRLYNTDMNNGQFVSFNEAEYWLKQHINEKNTVPYVTDQKFVTI
jgi:hypothetical protein